ncbi:5-aminolevulinate synthase, mitochondrial [Frankliniella fusca]|uniref:5-aminolevulinate synthase, mitochondrial n=1 Tax=Frankliniella fusca TaxID=407009 RepID=A0AAE1HVB4_9NEOP|nr:5-aminolevulinate synthase, mitochondrial [Frankliniella fusca]
MNLNILAGKCGPGAASSRAFRRGARKIALHPCRTYGDALCWGWLGPHECDKDGCCRPTWWRSSGMEMPNTERSRTVTEQSRRCARLGASARLHILSRYCSCSHSPRSAASSRAASSPPPSSTCRSSHHPEATLLKFTPSSPLKTYNCGGSLLAVTMPLPRYPHELGAQAARGRLQGERDEDPGLGDDGQVGGVHLVDGELAPRHVAGVVRPEDEGGARHRAERGRHPGLVGHAEAQPAARDPEEAVLASDANHAGN